MSEILAMSAWYPQMFRNRIYEHISIWHFHSVYVGHSIEQWMKANA